MAKKEKRCKECEGKGKDCKCPKKNRVGWYGLHPDDEKEGDESMDTDMSVGSGGEGGGLGESIKMPKAPSDADRSMKGISTEKKKKKLADFKAASDEAKKRQRDEDRKGELAATRRTKGIKFYDAKGSGYIKDGKKNYD